LKYVKIETYGNNSTKLKLY